MFRSTPRSALRMTIRALLPGLVVAMSAPTVATTRARAAFVEGDFYLLSNWLPDVVVGILRVDPLTGASALVVDLPDIPSVRGTLTYDRFRDRLVYADTRGTGGVVAVDASGNLTDLAPNQATPRVVAARGDGILYLCGLAGGLHRYLDAANVPHDLLDPSGMGGFHLPGPAVEEAIYDPGSNSLVCFTGQRNGVTCATANRTCALRIPLTEDGTQVSGPVEFVETNISPSIPIVAVGSGLCPTGEVLYVMDTNTNDAESRMQILDVATMTTSAYAVNGPYLGAASTSAGTYSRVRGQAVILDTSADSLRAYSQGESGRGTLVAGQVSASGGGEIARLVEIRREDASGVGEQRPERPRRESLLAWPNPCAGTLTVEFAPPAEESGSLVIHDSAGRRIRTFPVAPSSATTRSVRWDRKDDRGGEVPPGLYFLRFEREGKRWSGAQKVVIVEGTSGRTQGRRSTH